MITGQNVSLAAIFALLMGTVILYWQSRKRIAFDVLNDLSLVNEESTRGEKAISRGGLLDDELSQMGLLSLPERKRFLLIQKVIPCVGGIITLLWVGLILHASIVSCVIAGVAGVSLGYLLAERRKRILIERHKQALVYYLPMVMERIVMAIQTGLDIIAGITTLVELQAKLPDTPMDPVTRLLELAMSLSKAGMRFDEALREVAQAVDSSALRHAFVHLAMAQQDGGELVMPLRELSDATQLYYQETVDEEVARMPIKATLPLVLTFAGLIICFITSPLMQIINLTKEMTPGGL